ncbi:MAG: DNA polymerase I [Longimicrobiales bacterium]
MVEQPAKTRPRLFLIDGYALIYRAYFAMINRPLTTTYGENTSAAFGFTRFLMKIREEHEPDYLGIVLDAGTSARVERYPAYKATREKMPTDLEASLPRIRDLMKAFRVPVIQVPDHEADDVIGTLADRAADQGLEAVIVSGDKDFYQLIRPGVSLLNPGRGGQAMVEEEWVDLRNAAERLGVPPEHVVDYLALIGDASDNIPGARGIGPKTAIQLIDQFGSVEEVIARSDEISGKRAREAIQTSAGDIRLSKELITIRRDLPIALDLGALEITEPDTDRLRSLFVDLEFHSLAKDLGAPEEQRVAAERDYRAVDTIELVHELVDAARAEGRFALAVESSTGTAMRGDVVGLAVALETGPAYYVPLAHRSPDGLDFGGSSARNLPALDSPVMRPLADLMRDPEVDKIGHDLKASLLLLRRLGVELGGIAFDTEVASYVIDPGRRDQNLESLALQHLGHKALTREDVCGRGRDARPLPECPVESVGDYVAERAELALRLRDPFVAELAPEDLGRLFREIEMPLLRVLADMEWTGICIDRALFARVEAKLARDLALIKAEIYKVAGEEFNISSTPQLRTILFDKLELPVLRKTKTGASTDAAVLEELAEQGHALPKLILEYRQLDKLKGTYVDALPLQIDPRTGRIHTRFSQTVAATGRLSSSDPNLQNIPIRTEVGAEIRKGFIPAPGYRFLAADYSQIELRVMAHFSGDPAFVDAFRTGVDIHRRTAAIMFDVAIDQVSAQMRAAAKTVNFATLYGIGPFALSRQLGTSTADAKAFIEQYFAKLPDVRRYLDDQITMARELGYVQTIVGRRRYIPEIRSRNYNIRQFGERAATNAPVQGSAADIIKIAMIRIHDELRARDLDARMLLQVHDELVFEVPEDRIDESRTLVRELMENAVELDVPLEVATGVGATWWECK